MPSVKKLLASAVLFAAAYGAVVHQAEEAEDLSKRDIFVTINTHGGTSASACQLVDCFKQCEADGALGGVCDDADTCQCAYGTEPFRIQHSRVKGHTIAHGAEKTCDSDICNEVCYQKGGYTGGVCVDNACQCVKPTDAVSRPEKARDSPVSADGVECHNYSDCSFCGFYERCCELGKCSCGTTGRPGCH